MEKRIWISSHLQRRPDPGNEMRYHRGLALPRPFPLGIQGLGDNGEAENPSSGESGVIPQYLELEVERHGLIIVAELGIGEED